MVNVLDAEGRPILEDVDSGVDLAQLGVIFSQRSADIDETPAAAETPASYVQRMAVEKAAALRTAERLKALVLDERIPHDSSDVSQYVTISQGVVTVTPDSELEPGALLTRTDQALYDAKGAGRNAIAVG